MGKLYSEPFAPCKVSPFFLGKLAFSSSQAPSSTPIKTHFNVPLGFFSSFVPRLPLFASKPFLSAPAKDKLGAPITSLEFPSIPLGRLRGYLLVGSGDTSERVEIELSRACLRRVCRGSIGARKEGDLEVSKHIL